MTSQPLKLLISAGDASGDYHAAEVVKALRRLAPESEITAVGGPHLQATGVEMLHLHDGEGRIGPFDTLKAIPSHWLLLRNMVKFCQQRKPHACLMVDYGGFHLWLARFLPPFLKRCHYIPPQVWASRPGRMKTIQRFMDKVFCIFPFEQPLYEQAGVPVTFVGHPLLSQLPPPANRQAFCQHHGLDPERPIVGILPGSRRLEIKYLLAPFLQSLEPLQARASELGVPPFQFVVSQAPNLKPATFQQAWAKATEALPPAIRDNLTLVPGSTPELLSVAQFGLASSGTVTLEAAIYGTPVVIAYKIFPTGFWFAKQFFMKVPYIGLPNLLAKEKAPLLPELYQSQVNAATIAKAAEPWLHPASPALQRTASALKAIRNELGATNAAEEVAKALVTLQEKVQA